MPRLALAALTCLALLLPAAGCYRYDARARNLTAQDVRISIHKGTRKREISTAVLGPGASAGWTGSANGPVLMRVAVGGMAADVDLPRRKHTVVEIGGTAGSWSLIKTIGDESYSVGLGAFSFEPACADDCTLPCCADDEDGEQAGAAADDDEAEEAAEGDDDDHEEAEEGDDDDDEMLDLIEPDDG